MNDPVFCTTCRKPLEQEDTFCKFCGSNQSPPVTGDKDAGKKIKTARPFTPSRFASACLLLMGLASIGVASWSHWTLQKFLGGGIKQYDLTTPKATAISQLRMTESNDLRAFLELQRIKEGTKPQEKLKTIQFFTESEYKGAKLLFVSFEEDGIKKYDVLGFQKNAGTGLWYPDDVSTYEATNSGLDVSTMIRSWRLSGPLQRGSPLTLPEGLSPQ